MSYETLVKEKLGWLPEITDLDNAFGTTKGLPETASSIAYSYEDPHGFARFSQDIMFGGLEAAFFVLGTSESDETVLLKETESQRLYNWLHACLQSFQPKHEHKIGGLGLRLDQSLKGIAYLLPHRDTWKIAGEIKKELLPSPEEVRDQLKGKNKEK